MKQPETITKQLVFQIWTSGDGIFLDEAIFERFRAIHRALENCKTWGEFRSSLPEGEFEELGLWVVNDGDSVYRDGEVYVGLGDRSIADFIEDCADNLDDYLLGPDSSFEAGNVTGFDEGDYPPWTDSTAIDALPAAFVSKYGKGVSSMISGSWIEFPTGKLDEMTRELEAAGFTVRAKLDFNWSTD